MALTRFVRRLFRDTDGQVLLLGAILVFAILGFLLVIPNGTQVATQKVRAQTAADAGAFTGSIWLARTLNLSANMNVGIKGMYTWMTALTAAEALALALDSLVGTRGLACDMDSALFLRSDPRYVRDSVYPRAIQELAQTAQWLYVLQSDVDSGFPKVAQTLGSEQACRNVSGGNPSSQNPGGMVLVASVASLFVSDTSNLIFNDLSQLGSSLGSRMPPPLTDTTNVRRPTGSVTIDPTTYAIKATYKLPSRWSTLVQKDTFYIYPPPMVYMKLRVWQYCDSANKEDTATKDWLWPYGNYLSYMNWTLWIHSWLNNGHWTPNRTHDSSWVMNLRDVFLCSTFVSLQFTDMTDTAKWHSDSSHYWGPPYYPTSGKLISPRAQYLVDMGYQVIVQQSYFTFAWDTTTAAESTNGNQGTRLRPSRLNPVRELHALAYVWRQGASTAPFGLGPPMGGTLFPRGRVAAQSPLFTVARSKPYLATTTATATQYDSFFNPAWDVKLTPLDSAGVHDITSDTAFAGHSENCFNLDYERKYALLP